MKKVKFIIVLFIAKLITKILKLLRRNATDFPGKIALKLCKDFIGQIEKPEIIIGVTGTNGKTTVSNFIDDILVDNGYSILENRLGSNIKSGIATSLISGVSITGKVKKKIAVLEIDERSSKIIYPYLKPTYLICTNLFRDSLKRNAHTEFIYSVINDNLPKETILILNGDDPICSSLGKENKKIFFGIDRLSDDTNESENIVRDIIVCPKCFTKLKYDYYRYHHIGKMYCPNCDFKTPDIDYLCTNIDKEESNIIIKEKGTSEKYPLISDNIINIYNMIAAITVLKQIGIDSKEIRESMRKLNVVETRFKKEEESGVQIIMHLAKGQNPIACSRAFDYVRKQKNSKSVILILDDLHEDSEVITWYYDADYEFLNSEETKQIIVGGKRYMDTVVRLLIAGVPKEKIVYARDEIEATSNLETNDIEKVFILYDLYSLELCEKVKNKVKEKIKIQKKKEEVDNENRSFIS